MRKSSLTGRFSVTSWLGTAFVLLLLATAAQAQDQTQEKTWQPPVPAASGGKDWIRFKSGEWLMGEIQSMRDENLEFDSEELEILKLDWADVAEIRSERSLEYVFADGRSATGPAAMQEGLIKIRVGTEVREFPAAQLMSIIEGAMSEWDHWSATASLGFVARSGNTNQSDINTLIFVRREATRTRFDTKYTANFGELEGERNVNNHLFNSRVDLFLTQRMFVTPASIELYSDEFQNISLRSTLAAGLGYDVLQGRVDWYLQLGAGYLQTDYKSVEAGQSDVEKSAAVIPNTSVEWDPTGAIETSFSYSATISVPETKNAFHHAAAVIDVDVYGILDFVFSVTWDRAETPKPREDGSIPERDDFRVSYGLGIDF